MTALATDRRTSLRRRRPTRILVYYDSPEDEEEDDLLVPVVPRSSTSAKTSGRTASAVRQQLQAKVSGSLVNRGVNATDRWKTKPTGQLTPEEQKRLDRQRANKRRWARKERERSKKELEQLRKKNTELELRKHTLEKKVDDLRKLQLSLQTALSDHYCTMPGSRSGLRPTFTKPAPVAKPHTVTTRTTGSERNQGMNTGSGAETMEKTAGEASKSRGKRPARSKTSTCQRIENHSFSTLTLIRDANSCNEDSSFSHDPYAHGSVTHSYKFCNIDDILKSAASVPGPVPTTPKSQQSTSYDGQSTSGQFAVFCADDLGATAEDKNLEESQVRESPTQEHFLQADSAHQTLPSEVVVENDVSEFSGSFLQLLQDDLPTSGDLANLEMPVLGSVDSLEHSALVQDVLEEDLPAGISTVWDVTAVSEDFSDGVYGSSPRDAHNEQNEFKRPKSPIDTKLGSSSDIYSTGRNLEYTHDIPGREMKHISGAGEQHSRLSAHRLHSHNKALDTRANQRAELTATCRSRTSIYIITRPTDSVELERLLSNCSQSGITAGTAVQLRRSSSWENCDERTEGIRKRARLMSVPGKTMPELIIRGRGTVDTNEHDEKPDPCSVVNGQLTSASSVMERNAVHHVSISQMYCPEGEESPSMALHERGGESNLLFSDQEFLSASSSDKNTTPQRNGASADTVIEEGPSDHSNVLMEDRGNDRLSEIDEVVESMLLDLGIPNH